MQSATTRCVVQNIKAINIEQTIRQSRIKQRKSTQIMPKNSTKQKKNQTIKNKAKKIGLTQIMQRNSQKIRR